MNEKRMKDALEAIARRGVPENTNLMPRIAAALTSTPSPEERGARNERKSPMNMLRTRPLVAILVALLALLILSGVVYAIGRSLGYIPGYGLVDKNAQALVLAEPVSQTRDGITITINEMMLTSDKLFITSTTENIPGNLAVPMSDTTTVTCKGDWAYLLPDGSQFSFEIGGSGGTMEPLANSDPSKMSYRGSGFARFSKPVDLSRIRGVTLRIPCATSDIPAGSLPENWEFHLRFIPAPTGMLEMAALPVVDYTPVLDPTSTPVAAPSPAAVTETATPEVNPIAVTRMIDAGDSTILFIETDPPSGTESDIVPVLTLFDATGQQVFWEMPMDLDQSALIPSQSTALVWVTKFKKDDVKAFPITIRFVEQRWASLTVPFAFNVGENPQPGDEWPVNQAFDVDGHTFTLKTLRAIVPQVATSKGGYQFVITYPDPNFSVSPAIDGYPSVNEGFGGGGSSSEPFTGYGVNYSVEFASMPRGKLNIIFNLRVLDSEQSWTLPWQP
jgi:hypothetical protein